MSPKSFLFVYSLTLALLLTGVWGCKHQAPPPQQPTPTPIPAAPVGSVVFVERGHLVRLDLTTSQTVPLTSGQSTEWFPACSPDGSQVAYWSNAGNGVYNLWKRNLDGQNPVQLTFNEKSSLGTSEQNLLVNDAPSWSTDGKKIIYALDGDIWMIDSDGYNPNTLLTGHASLCPSLFPDGKSVLYLSNENDQVYNLWTEDLLDKTVKKLTQYTDWNVGSPSLSSDGKKILFNLYRANTTQIYTLDVDGTNPVNLTSSTHNLCPRFAMGDKRVVYCGWVASVDDGLNLFIISINVPDSRSISTDFGSSPSWAPARVVSGQ
jgi:Tol biopolymer transport system component